MRLNASMLWGSIFGALSLIVLLLAIAWALVPMWIASLFILILSIGLVIAGLAKKSASQPKS